MSVIFKHWVVSPITPLEAPKRIPVAMLLVVALMAGTCQAMDDGSDTEPNMHRTQLPPITTLTVQNSGATSSASPKPAPQCADFKLSDQEIRNYLGNAGGITEHDYFHMLDWSPCSTSGTVTFNNGVTGNWSIQQYRGGSLKLSDGQLLYLYCPQCQAEAFPAADE